MPLLKVSLRTYHIWDELFVYRDLGSMAGFVSGERLADIKSRSWLDWTYLRDGRESSKIRDQSERSFTRENQSHA